MALLNKIIDFIAMPFIYVIGILAIVFLGIGCGIKMFVFFLAKAVWEGLFAFEDRMFNCRLKTKYGKFLDFISLITD